MREFATPNKGELIVVHPERIDIVETRLGVFRRTRITHAMSLVQSISRPPGSDSVTITIGMTIAGREMQKEYSYAALDAQGLFEAILANMPRSDGSGLF